MEQRKKPNHNYSFKLKSMHLSSQSEVFNGKSAVDKWFNKSSFQCKLGLIIILLGATVSSTVGRQISTGFSSSDTLTSPKLVVGVVVDQMRYEYIPRFWDKYGDKGFKRLVREGYNFSNNHYNYVPTETGPGHAAIYTGTTPSINGIVGNNWFVRNTGRTTYVVDDSTVQTVGASDGRGKKSPVNLLSTTVTDELKTAYSHAKVIGVSMKDRAAILPAGHTADGAFWYDDQTGHFVTSTWYADKLPGWVQDFNNQELARSYSKKNWTPLLPIDEYTESNRDDSRYEGKFRGEKAPVFPHRMAGSLSRIISSPYGNTLVRKIAEAAVNGKKMGADNITDFLAVSFSSTDYVGHRFGPHSIELEDIYLRLDQEIAQFLSFLDKKVGKENYLLFLTADHGVVDVPASLKDRQLPGGYFDSKTAIDSLKKHLNAKYGEGNWVKHYINRQVYLNDKLIEQNDISRVAIQNDAAWFLLRFPGVLSTNTAHDFKSNGFAHGSQKAMYQNGFYASRSGDVIIELQSGWLGYPDYSPPTGTGHGSPYSYDTHVPLLFYGRNIPHSRTTEKTKITQIAPTISSLLQIPFPSGSADKVLQFND